VQRAHSTAFAQSSKVKQKLAVPYITPRMKEACGAVPGKLSSQSETGRGNDAGIVVSGCGSGSLVGQVLLGHDHTWYTAAAEHRIFPSLIMQ